MGPARTWRWLDVATTATGTVECLIGQQSTGVMARTKGQFSLGLTAGIGLR